MTDFRIKTSEDPEPPTLVELIEYQKTTAIGVRLSKTGAREKEGQTICKIVNGALLVCQLDEVRAEALGLHTSVAGTIITHYEKER